MTGSVTGETRDNAARAMAGRFRVADWAAMSPTIQTREGWLAWGTGEAESRTGLDGTPPEAKLPLLLRRRITPIGQLALRAAHDLAGAALPRLIMCSRHGEFRRTLGLLRAVIEGEPTSPADFSLAVHHALIGLLSIAAGNTAGHIAVAAGGDTFGSGMLEALGCLAERPREPVLLLYFDERVPEPYTELVDAGADASFALALLLAAPSGGDDDLALIAKPGEAFFDITATQQAQDFLSFLLSGRERQVSIGARTSWHWHRAPA